MKLKRSEKRQTFLFVLIIIAMMLILSCFITFLINIDKNIGIIPLIFILLSFYSLLTFFYHLIYSSKVIFRKTKYEIKIRYIIFFIVNVILSIFSIIVLWK